MPEKLIFAAGFAAIFALLFETCVAWLCAALARIPGASVMRSVRLLVYELFIPVPAGAVIGYAVGCIVPGPAGLPAGILCALGFSVYLFLVLARSVLQTSYARAVIFSLIFIAINSVVYLTTTFSPTVTHLRETIISWPK